MEIGFIKTYKLKIDDSIYEILYECSERTKDGHKMYHVRCKECGWEREMKLHDIIRMPNHCTHKVLSGQYRSYTHDLMWTNDRIKRIYKGMRDRCYNMNNKTYRWYGGKGIEICDEWLKNPIAFEEWALCNGYSDDLSIDRIDEERDYSPDNCRWISSSNNSKYKSTTKIIEVNGERHTGREWAEVLELGTNTINTMLRKYPEKLVKKFISARLNDKTIHRRSNETWIKAYGVI